MSDQEPDSGEAPAAAPPEPQSEPGAGNTAEDFADTAISAAPTEFAAGPQEQGELPTSVGKSARGSSRRALWAVGLGLGYVVLAAGTAFGVIIDKSPAPVDVTAVNASAYAAPAGSAGAAGASGAKSTASASAKSKSSASASPSAAPTSASPTPSPTPTSTVTGSVSDGVHSGDLRYFLIPPPQGPSSVQGDPDGNTETLDEAVTYYGGQSGQDSVLQQAGFNTGCDRTYQDSTMGANVSIQLIQFNSKDDAEQWAQGVSLNGADFASIPVPGETNAKGWSYAKDGSYTLIGMYYKGDTFFQVNIFATQSIPATALGQTVYAEYSRLANG